MLKHTNQPSVSPWKPKDRDNGEITMNCDCYSTWSVIIIRIHGKLYYVCVMVNNIHVWY